MNKYLRTNLRLQNSDFEAINYQYLISCIICCIPTEHCFTRQCDVCGVINPSDVVKQNDNIDYDENASWS